MKEKRKNILFKRIKIPYIILFVVLILVVAFWFYWFKTYNASKIEIVKEEKTDFIVDIKKYKDFSKETFIRKVWKIKSSQDINISSNANWRISNINVKEWDQVYKWQILANIEDNIWNYSINVSKAETWLERARINLESQTISLDKQISDSELNLEKLQKNYDTLKLSIEQNIKKAENDLNNSDYQNMDSKSALDLQKLDNTISKLELDYDNLLISNDETINWFLSSLENSYKSLSLNIDDIIDYWDSLLWVTDLHRNDSLVKKIDIFLWAKDKTERNNSEYLLNQLISYNNWEFDTVSFDDKEKVFDYLALLDKWFTDSSNFLKSLEKTLNNSIESVWSLSSSDISTYLTKLNWFQTWLQSNYSMFNSFDNSVRSFLRTYKNNQESSLKQIELTKKDREILLKSLSTWEFNADIWYNTTIINSEDSLSNLELSIKTAKSNLENAKKTKEVTIKSLQNSIDDAYISYLSATKEYSKLSVKSPIDWIIWDIFIDKWQEVWNWVSLFSITNKSSKEIEVSFSKDELEFIEEWKEVVIETQDKSYSWTIYSISNSADNNLNYKTVIYFTKDLNLLWDIVNINIPIKVENVIIPVNIVNVSSDSNWFINILAWESFDQKQIKLWKVWWDNIEVLDEIDWETSIVMTDISNYDSTKFNIKINNISDVQ